MESNDVHGQAMPTQLEAGIRVGTGLAYEWSHHIP